MRKSIHTRQQRALSRLLKEARIQSGLTQVAVARALRKPQSFIAKYERGERRLDVIELMAIADALAIDPREIVDQLGKA